MGELVAHAAVHRQQQTAAFDNFIQHRLGVFFLECETGQSAQTCARTVGRSMLRRSPPACLVRSWLNNARCCNTRRFWTTLYWLRSPFHRSSSRFVERS